MPGHFSHFPQKSYRAFIFAKLAEETIALYLIRFANSFITLRLFRDEMLYAQLFYHVYYLR